RAAEEGGAGGDQPTRRKATGEDAARGMMAGRRGKLLAAGDRVLLDRDGDGFGVKVADRGADLGYGVGRLHRLGLRPVPVGDDAIELALVRARERRDDVRALHAHVL